MFVKLKKNLSWDDLIFHEWMKEFNLCYAVELMYYVARRWLEPP